MMMLDLKKSDRLKLEISDLEYMIDELGLDFVYQSGDNYMCRCPVSDNHKNGDRTPSFGISTSGAINCFSGCFAGGTILDLIEYQLGIPKDEARKWLREHSVAPQGTIKKVTKPKKSVPTYYPIEILNKWRAIHPYVFDRGIDFEVAKEMLVGYDSDHNGIIIPHVFMGQLRGWQTRHIDKCSRCEPIYGHTPKYKSSMGFPKSETLYNYDNIVPEKKVIVVESPMTVLYLKSHGYENAVGTFGSWTKKQMELMPHFGAGVYLWPDSDNAGFSNIERVIDTISKLVPVDIVPILDKDKGDAADLEPEEIGEYLKRIYRPIRIKLDGKLRKWSET